METVVWGRLCRGGAIEITGRIPFMLIISDVRLDIVPLQRVTVRNDIRHSHQSTLYWRQWRLEIPP